ncbi:hypothetical protein TcCL_Unassigned03810, partial [Trypanosoma cruzi]
ASRGCALRSPLQLRLRATGLSSTSPRGGADVHCDGGRRAGHHIYLRKRENTSKTKKENARAAFGRVVVCTWPVDPALARRSTAIRIASCNCCATPLFASEKRTMSVFVFLCLRCVASRTFVRWRNEFLRNRVVARWSGGRRRVPAPHAPTCVF